MLAGTADPDRLARGGPEMPDFKTEALTLDGVEVLQVGCEFSSRELESHLPPGLHPTLPPLVTWLVYRAPTSPWGPFQMAQTRIECRSGLRPRAFQIGGVIDNDEARRALAARWGYRLRSGAVELRRNYDEVRGRVELDSIILDVGLRDPDPLAASDVHYVANMNLAHTPRGLRLVRVDPDYRVERVERGEPRLEAFDAAGWGDAEIDPVYPVAASLTLAALTLPALRFVCLPDAPALQSTERVDSAADSP